MQHTSSAQSGVAHTPLVLLHHVSLYIAIAHWLPSEGDGGGVEGGGEGNGKKKERKVIGMAIRSISLAPIATRPPTFSTTVSQTTDYQNSNTCN